MTKLTPRQQEILDFIRNTLEVLGAPPTRAEIANAFGFASHNAAEEHLKALARKGIIVLEPGSARGIRLVEQLGLPLIGSVAAGSPILAVENVQGRYALDSSLFKPRADFLLRVRGLSMINAGILDGDLLAVHRSSEARNGQIVVARLGDDVTVAVSEIACRHAACGGTETLAMIDVAASDLRVLRFDKALAEISVEDIRAAVEAAEGWPAIHAELARVDPASAARLSPTDSQRVQRALEVYRLSGRPLSALLAAAVETGAGSG